MDKLRALEYFVASAEEGSFAGAARRLEVSVPAIQKLINALERSLRITLFERTVHGLTLTASGARYHEACRPLLEELAGIDEEVTRASIRPSGLLVVGAHPQLVHPLLMPAIPRFRAMYPDIQLDLRVINRLTDADAESADVFFVQGWPEANDLVHRRLGHADGLIVAAPEYWAARGMPQQPGELAGHDCLVLRNPAGILLDLWEFKRDGEKVAVPVSGWLRSNGREVVLDGVLAGGGVGRFSRMTTAAHLKAGRLVPALTGWEVLGFPPLNLLYRPNVRRTPRVRLFIDFVERLVDALAVDSERISPHRPIDRPYWHRPGSVRASAALKRPGARAR
jgi:DNA-binding transcriptional LysR family regulator